MGEADSASPLARAPAGTQPTRDRRGRIARRDPSEDRLSMPTARADRDFGMLPRTTRHLVAVIPGAIAFNAAIVRSLPPVAALACFVVSLACLGALPFARRDIQISTRPASSVTAPSASTT